MHKPVTPLENVTYQYDHELLFLVGDWYHWQAERVLGMFMRMTSVGVEVCHYVSYCKPKVDLEKPSPDSLLVNGLGYFECSKATHGAPVDCRKVLAPSLSLDKTRRYRARLVNVRYFNLTIMH